MECWSSLVYFAEPNSDRNQGLVLGSGGDQFTNEVPVNVKAAAAHQKHGTAEQKDAA
jgi:hypothetical protein